MTIDRTNTLDEVTTALVDAHAKLRDTIPTLPPELIAAIVPHLFTDRPGRRFPAGRSLRPRSKPEPLSSTEVLIFTSEPYNLPRYPVLNAARTVKNIVKWHQSNGDLHALFLAKFEAGDLFEALDTLAQVLVVLSDLKSTALAGWRATGLV
jgi:hypothetical protein